MKNIIAATIIAVAIAGHAAFNNSDYLSPNEAAMVKEVCKVFVDRKIRDSLKKIGVTKEMQLSHKVRHAVVANCGLSK